MAKKALYLLDALNILFRSYHAIRPISSATGEPTAALYGFIRSLQKIRKQFSPTLFAAIFDGPNSHQARLAIDPQYKQQRRQMPPDLRQQIDDAITFCRLAGIPQLSIPGVEADDVIGSIATWAGSNGFHVYIFSSDKDLCQLVDANLSIYHIHKENLLVDAQKVYQIYGVHPQQMIDYLALIGDASDNIPGLPGFGAKTAASLLQRCGNLDAIDPQQISGRKKQEVLRQGRQRLAINRQLLTIDRTVAVPQEERFFRLHRGDVAALQAFYQRKTFLSLLQESPPQLVQHQCKHHLVTEIAALRDLLPRLQQEGEVVFDTEATSLHPLDARLLGVGLCTAPDQAWYVPLNGPLPRSAVLSALDDFFAQPQLRCCGHNLKYDLHVLRNENISWPQVSFDTILASYLLYPHKHRHSLGALMLEHFQTATTAIETLIGKGKKQRSMASVPLDAIAAYCCQDVTSTCRLAQLLRQQLLAADLLEICQTLELPLLPVLLRMERTGIYVDRHQLHLLAQQVSAEIDALQEEIYRQVGDTFNLNSSQQLAAVLFERLQLAAPQNKNHSTRAAVLEALQHRAPIVSQILDHRRLQKLRSTYLEALPRQIHATTQRIHYTLNQSTAATGRLACHRPNLQNIPIRSAIGKRIRQAFCPQQPDAVILSADYSQIELRLLAHLSGDQRLVAAFQAGEDIHRTTAAAVFGLPAAAVTSEMRGRAKAINFGVLYGQGGYGLSQQLGIPIHEANAFITTYFLRHPGVSAFVERCKEQVRQRGYSVTMLGRKRPIPDITSKNTHLRQAAERLAVNTPLQGSAADLIKAAMIAVDAQLQDQPLAKLILQIHDELLFEVPATQAPLLASIVRTAMESVMQLDVPLVVDISIGKNWGKC